MKRVIKSKHQEPSAQKTIKSIFSTDDELEPETSDIDLNPNLASLSVAESINIFRQDTIIPTINNDDDDDEIIPISNGTTVQQDIITISKRIKEPEIKTTSSKPNRRNFWIYKKDEPKKPDNERVPENLQPISAFHANQAINQLMIQDHIWGNLTDFEALEYFHCPGCGTRHEHRLRKCPACNKLFINQD